MKLPLPPAMVHYNMILELKNNSYTVATRDIVNDRYHTDIKTIPAGTIMKVDFVTCDRFYAFAVIDGVVRKVCIKLEDFNAIIPVKE